jgi:hypothetical protein
MHPLSAAPGNVVYTGAAQDEPPLETVAAGTAADGEGGVPYVKSSNLREILQNGQEPAPSAPAKVEGVSIPMGTKGMTGSEGGVPYVSLSERSNISGIATAGDGARAGTAGTAAAAASRPATKREKMNARVASAAAAAADAALSTGNGAESETSGEPLASSKSVTATALFTYTAGDATELSFFEGDVIVLLNDNNPVWWNGRLRGKVGMFPASYVQANPTHNYVNVNDDAPPPTSEPNRPTAPLAPEDAYQSLNHPTDAQITPEDAYQSLNHPSDAQPALPQKRTSTIIIRAPGGAKEETAAFDQTQAVVPVVYSVYAAPNALDPAAEEDAIHNSGYQNVPNQAPMSVSRGASLTKFDAFIDTVLPVDESSYGTLASVLPGGTAVHTTATDASAAEGTTAGDADARSRLASVYAGFGDGAVGSEEQPYDAGSVARDGFSTGKQDEINTAFTVVGNSNNAVDPATRKMMGIPATPEPADAGTKREGRSNSVYAGFGDANVDPARPRLPSEYNGFGDPTVPTTTTINNTIYNRVIPKSMRGHNALHAGSHLPIPAEEPSAADNGDGDRVISQYLETSPDTEPLPPPPLSPAPGLPPGVGNTSATCVQKTANGICKKPSKPGWSRCPDHMCQFAGCKNAKSSKATFCKKHKGNAV